MCKLILFFIFVKKYYCLIRSILQSKPQINMKYYENKPQGYYYNVRKEMLKYLPETANKILDIGCGNGSFSSLVKKKTMQKFGELN